MLVKSTEEKKNGKRERKKKGKWSQERSREVQAVVSCWWWVEMG